MFLPIDSRRTARSTQISVAKRNLMITNLKLKIVTYRLHLQPHVIIRVTDRNDINILKELYFSLNIKI